MPTPIACVLSYGLMCAAGDLITDVPEPTPLEPAVVAEPVVLDPDAIDPGSDDPADDAPGSKILAQVQAYYDATSDLTASFTQTYTQPVYGNKTVSKGKLRVKKPGKMVWDYSAKTAPDFYVTRKKLQVVEHDLRQVVSRSVDTADFAGAEKFLFGGRQLVEDFRVRMASERLAKVYGKPGHSVIELGPKKKNPHYVSLLLVVDDATGRVDAFVVRNADKSINEFDLSGVARNNGLADSEFTFTKPKGYAEVDG
ncbi:LolA family protein [Paraliomyxa miuraensis]|uniref:LolA family protein n=1 Tax=Paraliomyxa miuraensis TaxID=376150 RepID=UPI00224C922F|nr:outer membrane lipoprotein carrier protein LolA [Paraliomyxa miuraensis]MCX4243361.1 outer membrane lipoprotein carrier protein LolA [Paraliomyxa miuraensis]